MYRVSLSQRNLLWVEVPNGVFVHEDVHELPNDALIVQNPLTEAPESGVQLRNHLREGACGEFNGILPVSEFEECARQQNSHPVFPFRHGVQRMGLTVLRTSWMA